MKTRKNESKAAPKKRHTLRNIPVCLAGAYELRHGPADYPKSAGGGSLAPGTRP